MPNQRIAAIGDKDSVTAFKSVGVDVFTTTDREQTENKIEELAKQGYALILITEDKAEQIVDFIIKHKQMIYPILLPIPNASGGSELGKRLLRSNMEKAIGMDIVLDKDSSILEV